MTVIDTNETLGDATPERLAKSANNFIGEDGARRFQDDLLSRMGNKGQLYPNAAINTACMSAGERYYADWYGSNMSTLGAIDYGKVSGGSGGSGSHMPVSQRQAIMRGDYRKARQALGKKYRDVVEPILLHDETDLVALGRKVTGTAGRDACRAVAVERFTAGLYLLAKHYGFID